MAYKLIKGIQVRSLLKCNCKCHIQLLLYATYLSIDEINRINNRTILIADDRNPIQKEHLDYRIFCLIVSLHKTDIISFLMQ